MSSAPQNTVRLQEVPLTIGGRWEILAPIAEGGMGHVYSARHLHTGKLAAIKILDRDDPEAQTRFRLEARVAATLNHPGIADVYDAEVDEATGRFYLAMELLQGRTLREVMDDPAQTPVSLMRLLLMVLEPLVAAHEMGYVHRDLKPENIFVIGEGDRPQVKLLDFGIAGHELRKGLTQTGTAMGTPHYMSPEQAMDAAQTSPASDVWSMGVLLYEAISGKLPFVGDTPHAVVVRACTEDPTALNVVSPEVTSEVSSLVMRCLSKVPAGRPPHAAALRAELLRHVYPASIPASRIPSRRTAPAAVIMPARSPKVPATAPRGSSTDPSTFPLAISAAGTGVMLLALLARAVAAVGTPHALALASAGAVLTLMGALLVPKRKVAKRKVAPAPASKHNSQAGKTHTLPPPQRGPADALVTMEFYGDLCNLTSRRVAQRVLELQTKYDQEVKLMVQSYPQTDDATSWLAAEIAEELLRSHGVTAFWGFFEAVVNAGVKLGESLLMGLAEDTGTNMISLRHALRVRRHRPNVMARRSHARSHGVTHEPTVHIAGEAVADLSADGLAWALADAIEAARRTTEGEHRFTSALQDGRHKMRLRRILVSYKGARYASKVIRRSREQAQERADKVRARAILPGTDFVDLAIRFGDGAVELGVVDLNELPPQLIESLLGLAVGEITEPVEASDGFHILQRLS